MGLARGRRAARVRPALERLRDHAEASAALAARPAAGADRGADPLPGRAARPGVGRAAAARGRGQLMHGRAGHAPSRAGRSGSARAAGPRRPPTSRWPSSTGPLGLLLSLIEARQLDVLTVPLGAPRRRLPRCARDARSRPARQRQRVRRRRQPADPHQEPGDAAAARRRSTRRSLADEAPDPEAELRARLILYRAHRDAGLRLAEAALARIGLFRREPARPTPPALAGARPARRAAARPGPPRPRPGPPGRTRAAARAPARGHAADDHPDRARRRSSARRSATPRRSCSRTCSPASATGSSSRSRSSRCWS